jgi:hypothetical protein
MPKINFDVCCKRELFLRKEAAEQKYQNILQLLSRPAHIHLVNRFNFPADQATARSGTEHCIDTRGCHRIHSMEILVGFCFDDPELGDRSKEMAVITFAS